MESDSNFSGGSSSRIQNLVEDLGDENFETRNEALMSLKAMLPTSEVSISNALVEIVSDHGDNEAGSKTSFVNKGAIELFQNMSELGLEPLVNDLLKDGDVYSKRVATDAIGRTGRMAVLPYLIKCMNDDDMYVRWQAAKGLGRFAGSSDARDALVDSDLASPRIEIVTRISYGEIIEKNQTATVCKISIIDNGPGIPDKIKDSIFFPMITGKEKGTGLGLSITQGIISQHKGNVHYNTRSNRTEFFINLPITNSQEKLQEIANG